MPNFVVHVGPHKTGSTYLQRQIAASRSVLLRQGVATATDWQDSVDNPSHTGLTRRLNADRVHELERQFSSWEDGGYKHVVLSTEELVNTSMEALALLRKLIGKNSFVIVYYVRAWPELMASLWNELVVHGHLVTLPEVAAETLRSPYSSKSINVAIDLERLERAFDGQNIRIVSYNSVMSANLDLFEHFVDSFLNGVSVGKDKAERANQSFEPAEAELVRILNCLHQKAGNSRSAEIAMKYRFKPQTVNAAPLLELLGTYIRSFDIDDAVKPMATIVQDCSNRYRSMVVPPAPPDLLYRVGKSKLRYCSTEYSVDTEFLPTLQQFRLDLFGEKKQSSMLSRLLNKR